MHRSYPDIRDAPSLETQNQCAMSSFNLQASSEIFELRVVLLVHSLFGARAVDSFLGQQLDKTKATGVQIKLLLSFADVVDDHLSCVLVTHTKVSFLPCRRRYWCAQRWEVVDVGKNVACPARNLDRTHLASIVYDCQDSGD